VTHADGNMTTYLYYLGSSADSVYAAIHAHPFFEVGLNGPVKEHSGEVLMGTLGWTGNFPITRIGRDSFMWITCVVSIMCLPEYSRSILMCR